MERKAGLRRLLGWSGGRLLAMVLVGGAVCGAQTVVSLPVAPSSILAAQQAAASLGIVSGDVVDPGDDAIRGAQITLIAGGGKDVRKVIAGDDGTFRFTGVPAGAFTVKATAPGMEAGAQSGSLLEGEHFELPEMTLGISSVSTVVEVLSPHEQAAQEIRVEEHQRLGGVVPNFYVVYNWDAAPMDSRQKYGLAWKSLIDPVNQGINAGVAGIQYWQNLLPGYGKGWSGYGKLFGANEGGFVAGTLIGGAVLPALLHQDPRYFYMGRGTWKHRLLYAVASAVICKGDNGKWQLNYSSVGADIVTGEIVNSYYPKANQQGTTVVVEQGLLGALEDGIGNVLQEFAFKKATPHAPVYAATTP